MNDFLNFSDASHGNRCNGSNNRMDDFSFHTAHLQATFFFFLERHNHLFSQIDNTYNSTLYFFKKNFMDILLTKMPNVISVIGVGPFYNYKTMKIK